MYTGISQVHMQSHIVQLSLVAKSQSLVEKTAIVLEVKPDIKNFEREEIVKTVKDTMVCKSIMPEFVVSTLEYLH